MTSSPSTSNACRTWDIWSKLILPVRVRLIMWSILGIILLGILVSSRLREADFQPAPKDFNGMVDRIVTEALPKSKRKQYGEELKAFILSGIPLSARDRLDGFQWILAANRADIFMCKIVYPELPSRELFPYAKDTEEEQYIAWIVSEITQQQAKERLPSDYQLKPTDRCFSFASPPYSWRAMCGQAGVLVIRDKRIAFISAAVVN